MLLGDIENSLGNYESAWRHYNSSMLRRPSLLPTGMMKLADIAPLLDSGKRSRAVHLLKQAMLAAQTNEDALMASRFLSRNLQSLQQLWQNRARKHGDGNERINACCSGSKRICSRPTT